MTVPNEIFMVLSIRKSIEEKKIISEILHSKIK